MSCSPAAEGARGCRGELRTSQNWIGGTRPGNALFVPPPAHELLTSLGALEKLLHNDPVRIPTLIKAALAHVQFETIHPFLDGNGRLGRLLITFLLCAEGAMAEPLLYLSLYFKTHRDTYYDLLQQARVEGDWEAWLRFFLEGVASTAEQATSTAHRVLALLRDDRAKIDSLGRVALSVRLVHELMSRRPLLTIPRAASELGLTQPTIATAMQHMQALQIVAEITGRKRDRVFAYSQYVAILNEGTTPP